MPSNVNNSIPGVSGLGIDVSVKLPGPLTTALKLVPSIGQQLPKYAQSLEQQTARAQSAIDSVNLTVETLGIALVFGGIIVALLMREKK